MAETTRFRKGKPRLILHCKIGYANDKYYVYAYYSNESIICFSVYEWYIFFFIPIVFNLFRIVSDLHHCLLFAIVRPVQWLCIPIYHLP